MQFFFYHVKNKLSLHGENLSCHKNGNLFKRNPWKLQQHWECMLMKHPVCGASMILSLTCFILIEDGSPFGLWSSRYRMVSCIMSNATLAIKRYSSKKDGRPMSENSLLQTPLSCLPWSSALKSSGCNTIVANTFLWLGSSFVVCSKNWIRSMTFP